MRCHECDAVIDPETDRHANVREELVAPDLGVETRAGRTLCRDCGDVADARLAPN